MDAPLAATSSPTTRAALAVWVTAAVEVVLFGACALIMGLASMTPADQLRHMDVPAEVTPGQLRVMMWAFAGGIAATMWLPGLALLFLGFGVREGRRGATLAAGIILIVQAVLLGLFVVLPVLNTLFVGGPLVGVVVHLVIFGGLLWLVGWAARRVFAARAALRSAVTQTEEPWNSHLDGSW